MGRKEIYTKEQIHAMKMNPYTHSVNAYQITFTLEFKEFFVCLLYTSPSPRDGATYRMPSSA